MPPTGPSLVRSVRRSRFTSTARAPDAARLLMRSDCTYIHCNNSDGREWRLIASTGGHVSIAGPIEMEMGHGIPPFKQALDHGIRPSLSVDVETEMPGDLFTQMRTAFTLQRMQCSARERAGERNLPALLTVSEVVEFATIRGRKRQRARRKIGTLTPGKEADIILLRHDRINVTAAEQRLRLRRARHGHEQRRHCVHRRKDGEAEGQLVGVDLARVNRLARESRDYILGKTGWPRTVVR